MKFRKNVYLDAQMVFASMKGGIDGLMQFGFLNRNLFRRTKDVIERTKWLKKQNDKYIKQVSNEVINLEKINGKQL